MLVLAAATLGGTTCAVRAQSDIVAPPPVPIQRPGTNTPTQPDQGPIVPPARAPAAQPSAPAAAPQGAAPASPAGLAARGQFGAWQLQCVEDAAPASCQIAETVGQNGRVVVVISLAYRAADGSTAMQAALPLGVSLLKGVDIAIGNEVQGGVPVSRCTARGCIVEGEVTDDLLEAMRRGSTGAFIVRNDAGASIPLEFSLAGFTAAFDAMLDANGETSKQ